MDRSATEQARGAMERGFREHRRLLWGLSYRMTGSAADADEIVQDTFVRALARPPRDLDRSLRPWLVRIATNLAVDALRRRQRSPYVGPWLPEPIETSGELDDLPGAKYERLESVTFAFLCALEALAPKQRAVLLLRDVMDYSVLETAEALGITENHVKVLHHRARKKMAAYEQERRIPDERTRERTRRALQRFVEALLTDDVAGLEAALTDDVVTLNDANGEYHAARKPVTGRDRVVRFHRRIRRSYPDDDPETRMEVRTVNGLPALVVWSGRVPPGIAPRQVVVADVDPAERIRHIRAVLADEKIERLFRREAAD